VFSVSLYGTDIFYTLSIKMDAPDSLMKYVSVKEERKFVKRVKPNEKVDERRIKDNSGSKCVG
jgi:hypothetical protein